MIRFKYFVFVVILLSGIILVQCKCKRKPDGHRGIVKISSLPSPRPNSHYVIGDSVLIDFTIEPEVEIAIDSVQFLINNKVIYSSNSKEIRFYWHSSGATVGNNILKTRVCSADTFYEENSTLLLFKSDIKPTLYTYQVVKTYPHDRAAYTQGLVYRNGIFFEGTGLRGESTLRKVEIETGKVLKNHPLSDQFFGEGITILNNKIIQLTWQSRVGFVYDEETMNLEKQLYYPTQGWGLTNNGKDLIMSDGSHFIYFLNPENFKVDRKIEVFDQNGPVINLNELEMVDGMLWANVYTSNWIVIIDPKTGKVTGKIDFTGIINPKDYDYQMDVFNGIAYDSTENRIFVTGKLWPKMFEVKVLPKNPAMSKL